MEWKPRSSESHRPRVYTRPEHLADAIIHATGVVLSVLGAVILLNAVSSQSNPVKIVSAWLYTISLMAMLWFSAAYNLLRDPVWKERTRPCDHATIFLLIAGTYTPFLLVGLASVTSYTLLAIVWVLAIIGMAAKLFHPRRYDPLFVGLYLALGWIGLPVVGPLIEALPASALALLATGGVLYTTGVAFHLWERLPFQNAIWHGFVLVAAVCHFFAVLQVLGGHW